MKMKRLWGPLLGAGLLLTLSLAGTPAKSNPASFTCDISEGGIVISDAGGGNLEIACAGSESAIIPAAQVITLTGISTGNTITVGSGVSARIALQELDLRLESGCAFNMGAAAVELTLIGRNTLQSGAQSAGLSCPAGATLHITGPGSLDAAGGEYAAGIGGGLYGPCGNISISGGTVSAAGGEYAAGIGGGFNGACGSVSISGGTVSAVGGTGEWGSGAGIGSGAGCSEEDGGGVVSISGGTVSAAGGEAGGAGIGGGFDGSAGFGSTVFISGGTVSATGYGGGAGIGSGSGGGFASNVNGGAVAISGGTILAGGNDGGAGIGGGWGCGGASIVISGGSVRASSLDSEPVNRSGVNVYRTVVMLEESPGAAVRNKTVCLLAAVTAAAYEINDLGTDDEGKLYLYLPADTLICAAQTMEGTPAVYATYRGTIRTTGDGAASGALTAGPAPPLSIPRGGSASFTAPELGLTPLIITALGADIDADIAAAVLTEGRVTVTGLAAGDTSLTVSYNNGSAESVPITVHDPQSDGDFLVTTRNVSGYSYSPEENTLLFTQPGCYTISMKDGVTATSNDRIQVDGGTAAEPVCITLNNVEIQSSACAFELQGSSCVNLLLAAGTANTLASGAGKAGIRCEGGAILNIGGPGSLMATGGSGSAGIGGNSNAGSGTICVSGGSVVARGGSSAHFNNGGAGIGGGYSSSAGAVHITGGAVDAGGGAYAAGIGGGAMGKGGSITISGGMITAGGGSGSEGGGAGIGSGYSIYDVDGTVRISGGTVISTGGSGGAGIGGGKKSNYGGSIYISGGTITAGGGSSSGGGGAGIGSGQGGALPTAIHVYISGGSVKAGGGAGAQDIGKGAGSPAGITLQSAAGGGVNVYRTMVQLSGMTGSIDILDLVTGAGYAYGIRGMKSDAEGRLYLYLPQGTATAAARAGGSVYTGSVITTEDPLTSQGILTLAEGRQGAFQVETECDYIYSVQGVLQVFQPGGYLVSMAAGVAETTTDRIIIDAPLSTAADPVRLTINNVNIIHGGTAAPCALEIAPGSTVELTLAGQNTLKSGRNHAGLGCPDGAALAIGGSGALAATGGDYGAGIGGGRNEQGGRVTITSGTVEAYNNYGAAGIGGGFADEGIPCNGGEIIISGGKVTAGAGSGMGAGLGGGGNGGCGGSITITGGKVATTGGTMNGGAGIGGGEQGNGGSITITGGTITATGGGGSSAAGAGIGGGHNGTGGNVVITGGTISAAAGGEGAEAIGHGKDAADSGTLRNRGGADVYLTTIALQGVNKAIAVTSFSASRPYCINDVFTDTWGKLYFYLPQRTLSTAARAAGMRYTGSIATTAGHDAEGILYPSGETIRLSTPSSLQWDSAIPGKAKWNAVPNASAYSVQLYKDGAQLGSAVNVPAGTACDFTSTIETAGSGSYSFEVTALGDDAAYTNSMTSEKSSVYAYTAPPVPLEKPAGVTWDSAIPGKAKWNAVPNASAYSVQLYKDGAQLGSAVNVPAGTACNFISTIETAGSGSYSFEVTALGDGAAYTDSMTSEKSGAYAYTAPKLAITTTELAAATVASAYTQDITFIYTGEGALSFSAAGLPSGLSINSSNGQISGTPAIGANIGSPYSIEIRATDGSLSDRASYTLVVHAKPGPEAYIITAVAGPGGSITPAGTLRVAPGDSITFTITAETNFAISSVTVDGIDEGALSSYTFNHVKGDHTISAAFHCTGGNNAGEPAYLARTLTNWPSGITVSGKSIHREAQLIISPLSLHPDDPACNTIRQAIAAGQLVLGCNIKLTRDFKGKLTISIPLDSRYDGQRLTVLHCINGRLETINITIAGGKALFTVAELSPFALIANVLPRTGGDAIPSGQILSGSIVAAAVLCALWRARRRRA